MIRKLTDKLNGMKKEHRLAIKILIVLALIAILAAIFTPAQAGRDITINNYYEYPEPPPGSNVIDQNTVNNFSVTSGVSDSDLQQGLAAAIAGGSHQFDFSTTDYQLSISGVWEVSDENETGYSFGFGKRWKEHKYIPDALFHMNYTPNSGQDYVGVGATFRIK